MAIARVRFSMMLGFWIAVGSMQVSLAQIFTAASDSTDGGVTQADIVGNEPGEVKQTSWPSISMPQIKMPQMTMPNLWPSAENDRPALLGPVAVGASKVSQGSKKAWEGMKGMFSTSAGEEASSAPAVAKQPRPSMWKRLITRKPQKSEPGPQTVGEFMSQKRMNP